MNELIGYALLVIGILLMLFSFLLGYSIYTNLANNNVGPAQIGGNTLNDTVRSGLQSADTTLYSGIYTTIDVLVLFLFASIGYKLAFLGIHIVNGVRNAAEAEGSAQVVKRRG